MSDPSDSAAFGGAYRVRRADGPVIAQVSVPPSKSIVNRALVCAALADGTSEITGVAPGDDTTAMIDCLQQLGCGIGVRRDGDRHIADVIGTGAELTPGPMRLDAGLAGTTSRFVTALCALGDGEYTVDGAPPLRARPMGPLHDSLAALGATVTPGESAGSLPVTISGPLRRADAVVMPGDVSSQYVTALMLIAPYIPGGLKLWLSSGLVSRPYLEITRSVMAAFGVTDVDIKDVTSPSVRASTCPPSTSSNPMRARRAIRSRPQRWSVAPSACRGSALRRCRATPGSSTCCHRWAPSSRGARLTRW